MAIRSYVELMHQYPVHIDMIVVPTLRQMLSQAVSEGCRCTGRRASAKPSRIGMIQAANVLAVTSDTVFHHSMTQNSSAVCVASKLWNSSNIFGQRYSHRSCTSILRVSKNLGQYWGKSHVDDKWVRNWAAPFNDAHHLMHPHRPSPFPCWPRKQALVQY